MAPREKFDNFVSSGNNGTAGPVPFAGLPFSCPSSALSANTQIDPSRFRSVPVSFPVNAADVFLTRANVGKTDAASLGRFDFNRDDRIDAADVLIARNNQRHTLPLFTAPASAAPSALVVAGGVALPAPRLAARRSAWEELTP